VEVNPPTSTERELSQTSLVINNIIFKDIKFANTSTHWLASNDAPQPSTPIQTIDGSSQPKIYK